MTSTVDGGSGKTGRVALVGRPNTGKSTLFNYLTRSRRALVKNQPGVTRDVQAGIAEWWGSSFEVLDTGGLTAARDDFSPLVRAQVLETLKRVDLAVMVLDGRAGICPEDRDVLQTLKESQKPYLLVINKVDRIHDTEVSTGEFFELGEDFVVCSFEKGLEVDRVVEWILKNLPESRAEAFDGIRIAVVGSPNVGKSSLCNRLLGRERMIVSPLAHTTVDSVADGFEKFGRKFVLVDTAGLRRRAKRTEGVEKLSAFKSLDELAHADIVLLAVDTTKGLHQGEAQILERIIEEGKPVILVATKEDLAQENSEYRKTFRASLQEVFHFFPEVPLQFISSHTGRGIDSLLKKTIELWDKLHLQITTPELNDFFFDVIRQSPKPVYGTQDVKFYYLTQTHQVPPSFICFANYPEGVTPSYRRFLTKRIAERWRLEGVPIRLFVFKSGKEL